MRRNSNLFIAFLLVWGCLTFIENAAAQSWTYVDKGLHIGEFKPKKFQPFRRTRITVVKINPELYEFTLLTVSERGHEPLRTNEWCERYDLIAAINAGMYQTDLRTHAGFMKNFDHINNSHVNSYRSATAFHPVADSLAPFYIFDLDRTPLDSIAQSYHTVFQNLRLIKRPRENRWSPQNRKWSEAALAQDSQGNVLLIYSPTPYSMHEFNSIILNLPLDIVCAQHLEGGPPASLHFSYRSITKSFNGSSKSIFDDEGNMLNGLPLPSVVGVREK